MVVAYLMHPREAVWSLQTKVGSSPRLPNHGLQAAETSGESPRLEKTSEIVKSKAGPWWRV